MSGSEETIAGPLVQVDDLRVGFSTATYGVVEVLKGVSFSLNRGEALALVGESGSGKSVTALSLTRLLPEPPAKILGGTIRIEGKDVLKMGRGKLRKMRGAKVAYVFQEPSTSLNPVFSIRSQMEEVLKLHRPDVARRDREAEIVRWLYKVGVIEPERKLENFAHELTGGMQQRIMIAMALCCQPDVLVADEPTTALDVTIQAQIIGLLKELKEEMGMAILLVTHDFGILGKLADRVAVMYQGKIVEMGTVADVITRPEHEYTKALIGCVPQVGHKEKRLPTIPEEVLALSDSDGVSA